MPKEFKTDQALKEAGAYVETNKHDAYKRKGLLIAGAVAAATLPLVWPANVLFHPGIVGNPDFMTRLGAVGTYFADIGRMMAFQLSAKEFFQAYVFNWVRGIATGEYPLQWIAPVGWAALPLMLGFGLTAKNPYRKTPNVYGDARYATEEDIMAMGNRNLVGFEGQLTEKLAPEKKHPLFLVGKMRIKGEKQDRMIRMGETLSILLLAPPGTGKSIGFIVPSIVELDHASLFIHDQKPELFDMTSGHRAKVGPVFQLRWSAQDAPEGTWLNEDQLKLTNSDLLDKDPEGQLIKDEMGAYKTKPIFYPCWNPLSPKSMPGPGDRRGLYIDRLVSVLCPDPKSGGDKFWTSKARQALTGLIQFLVSKVDFASNPLINGSWDGIPDQWKGREASFPMLIDWLADAQTRFDDGSEDPMRQMFKACVDEARAMDEKFEQVLGQTVLNQSINELIGLMNSPDKTRGSILQTADEALGPFKNAAVRQRTSTSDFAFNELRGMPKPEAKAREEEKMKKAIAEGRNYKPRYAKDEFLPISIYISVNLEDAKTFSSLTGIFVDAANAYLVANGPNAIDDQGNQCGPHDFGFLLDEAPQLPKLDTVTNGPAVGRSKRVFYVIVGQDFGQFEEKYSKPEVETLKSTTAIKIVLTQNNDNSAKQIASMVGKMTVVKHSYSPSDGGGGGKKGADAFMSELFKTKKDKASESLEAIDFIKPDFVMSMPEGKHLVIVQNYSNRPIYAQTPRFFETPSIAGKVYNLRSFKGPEPTTPMPVDMMEHAALRLKSTKSRLQSTSDLKAKSKEPRVVTVISPDDARGLTRNEYGQFMAPENDTWTFAEVDIPEEAAFVNIPDDESIMTTNSPQEAAAFLQGGRTLMFDQKTFDHLNKWLEDAQQPKMEKSLAIFLADRAREAGEEPGESLYHLGYQGSTRQELPDDPRQSSPDLAVAWTINIMSFVLGVEEQRRLFDLG